MRLVTVLTAALSLLDCAQAHAYIVTFDPDNYAIGTNLTHAVPGVTVNYLTHAGGPSYAPVRSDVFSQPCTPGGSCFPGMGAAMFGGSFVGNAYVQCRTAPGPTSFSCFESTRAIEFTFGQAVDYVQVSGTHWVDDIEMYAFDINDNFLGGCTGGGCRMRQDDQGVTLDTLWMSRPEADIYRVVAGNWGAFGWINQMSFNVVVVPEPGTFALLGGALLGSLAIRRRRKVGA
jgi:hypothetical protein